MSKRPKLAAGLYDTPVTVALDSALAQLGDDLHDTEQLDHRLAARMLAWLVSERAEHVLASFAGEGGRHKQVELVNAVIALLGEHAEGGVLGDDAIAAPARRLLEIREAGGGPATPRAVDRPSIPLSSSDLLVNSRHDLSVGPEIVREIASADRVDLLCSFLKWSGVRLLENALRELCQRRGPGSLRILTTAYMAATDRRALETLVGLGARVRVSYDTTRTRLHAKAWFFSRQTGFSTAFVGSSNLSHAALVDGLEWNVRLSQVDNRAILERFHATFEHYWADTEFREYDAREFDRAVRSARRAAGAPLLRVDIEPRPHQREILDDLTAERAAGHTRNLVVAATGTGKTIIAALDYRNLRDVLSRARLLFVAHRREILEQSFRTFQVVLRDGGFGELLMQGDKPSRWDHVFASIQSLRDERLAELPPDHFDVVIVDEFHHAAAASYDRLLAHVKPTVLLGLTATPERADGRTILGHFDGRIASEMRLWKALDQQLLCPFHYFGIGGAPDLRAVRWSGRGYDVAQLSNVYTADHLFAKRVLQEVARKVDAIEDMRALGFCVDIAHADFMAERFNEAGISAASVSTRTDKTRRRAALEDLRRGELQAIFSVDLFNEGVDLPDVNTVIFLRPTESATVFLQQLGRGLRLSHDKPCLTVLDFIGDANRKFRFDQRFRALIGGTRRSVQRAVEQGFPSLPAGCCIQLDRQSQRAVLDNVRHALALGAGGLVDDLRELARASAQPVTLRALLAATGADLEDIYLPFGRRPWSFTRLRRAAGLETRPAGRDDARIERAFGRMLHLDDRPRLRGLRELASRATPPEADEHDPLQRMLFMLLGHVRQPLETMQDAWRALWASSWLREELVQLLEMLEDRTRRITHALPFSLSSVPVRVHATYSLDEVMTAFDERSAKNGIKRIQTGVYFVSRLAADLLFVTLEKRERDYTPTTLYNDYPLSPNAFHWETQSNCHVGTPTGKRYVSARGDFGADGPVPGGGHVLLFVRQRRQDDRRVTMPYVLLGPCRCSAFGGARPMQIEWELEHAIPASLYQEIKVAAA